MSISQFQYQVYWSFILSFCTLGFVGVLLLRNSLRYSNRKLAGFARGMGWMCCGLSFHGFLVTYLYVNYLRGDGAQLPLAATVLAWVFAAPWVVLQLKYFLGTRRGTALLWWAFAYAVVYVLALFGAGAESSLQFSLISCALLALCSATLWQRLRVLERSLSRGALMLGIAAYPILLLVRDLGAGEVLIQLLFNLATTAYALALLFVCNSWNRASV